MESRELGKKILGLYSKNKNNITLLEENIWILSNEDEDCYKKILYNTTGILYKHGAQEAYNYLKNYDPRYDGFNCSAYEDVIKLQEEEDDFIQNPVTVVEGVNVCHKCGSKKTISYNKQTRSADEGTTVFCCCYICGNKWKM